MAKKISELSAASTISGSEQIPMLQSGSTVAGPINEILRTLIKATSYTPTTGSDLGTCSNVSMYYITIGSCIFIFGSLTIGTAGGGTDVWISLPSGLNLKSTKIVSRKTKLGECTRLFSSRTSISSTLNPHLCYDSGLSSATNRLRFASYTQSGLYDQDAASGLFNNNEVISIATGPLPIDELGG